MLKRRLCEASFTWKLKCDGPLLIADGRYEKKKDEPNDYPQKVFISHARDAEEIRATVRRGAPLQLSFYVPGTSLRGPFRSQAERILRSLLSEGGACDPFDMQSDPPRSCSKLLDSRRPSYPYAEACPACKLFGCTATASRIQFADAGITGSSIYRDMIGIDRFTGGAYSGAKMRFHVLEGSTFQVAVAVRNFELWQLGLLAYVFRDFEDGLVPIGFGKSKGFGQVKGSVEKVMLTYPAGRCDGLKVEHLGSLCHEPIYGLQPFEPPVVPLTRVADRGLSLFETFEVGDVHQFWSAVAPAFNDFITGRSIAQETATA